MSDLFAGNWIKEHSLTTHEISLITINHFFGIMNVLSTLSLHFP